jgi:hypothetical protein
LTGAIVFHQWIANASWPVLASLWVLGWTVFSVGGLLATRRAVARIPGETGQRNDIVGYYLSAVGVFYGISIGLIAVASWQSYSEADSRVAEEAATLQAVRNEVLTLPDSAALEGYLDNYTEFVIHCAWDAQAEGGLSGFEIPISHADTALRLDSAFIRPFRQVLNNFTPKDAGQANVQAETMRKFSDLLRLRQVRLHSVSGKLPESVWWIVLLGGALNIAITWLFVVQSLRMHLLLNVGIATMIGVLIFLISSTDEPFRGSLRVTSDAFKEVHGKLKNDESTHGPLGPVEAAKENEHHCHEMFPTWHEAGGTGMSAMPSIATPLPGLSQVDHDRPPDVHRQAELLELPTRFGAERVAQPIGLAGHQLRGH